MLRTLALGTLLLMSLSSVSATQYSARPIRGKVVDSSTGAPLEDVLIVVEWTVVDGSGGRIGALELMEAITGKNGEFRIEGWGPTTVSDEPLDGNLPGGRIPPEDPRMILLK